MSRPDTDAAPRAVVADRLKNLCCLNERCVAYGARGAGNLSVCGFSDRARSIAQIYCCVCKHRFSERKGTVFYRSRMPAPKVLQILQHVQEGNGMRQTGRLVGCKEETVSRYARLAGQHARLAHDQLVAFSPSHPRGATG
jgi:transposase-like protein